MPHASDHTLATPDGRLFARRWQASTPDRDAAPFVLLHDSLGCVDLWRDFPDRLASATGRTVIAYDRLGFGRSDPHPGTLPRDFIHAEARTGFQAIRQAFALDRFIAFGHSVGGGMAVGIAAAFPEACDGMVVESAQALVEDVTLAGVRAARGRFADPAQVDRLRRYHGDKAPWVLAAWIDTWLAPGYADWTLEAGLPPVHCPALVLHGWRDEFGSPRHPERIARLTTGPAQCVVRDWGHVPHRDAPDAILDLVVAWLAEPSAPGAVSTCVPNDPSPHGHSL